MNQAAGINRRALIGAGLALGAGTLLASSTLGQGAGTATPEATPAVAYGTQPDGSWLFVDDLGTEIRLPEAPQRIVAELSAAASLWDFGIRPVGVFGITTKQDGTPEIAAGRVDLESVENLGEGFDDFDLERLVGLEPDLIATSLYGTLVWRINADAIPQVTSIAPIAGVNVSGISVIDIIERYTGLAEALGADLSSDELKTAQETFEASAQAVRDAAAANPELSLLYVTGASDTYYIGNATAAGDLMYFKTLGVNIPQTENTTDYWEAASWEETNKYPTDVIQVDRRADWLTVEQMMEFDTFANLPAVVARQVGTWDVEFVNRYQGFAPVLDRLADTISSSDPNIV